MIMVIYIGSEMTMKIIHQCVFESAISAGLLVLSPRTF